MGIPRQIAELFPKTILMRDSPESELSFPDLFFFRRSSKNYSCLSQLSETVIIFQLFNYIIVLINCNCPKHLNKSRLPYFVA